MIARLVFERLLTVPHMLPQLRDADPIRCTKLGDAILLILLNQPTYYESNALDTYIYDESVFIKLRSTWNSGNPWGQIFRSIGGTFITLLQDSDKKLRESLTLSVLEPVCSEPLRFPST